jgi:Tfp pilus assembly protein PilO
MDALNSQMNTLVESQAQEIKQLKEQVKNSDSELVVLEHYRKTMDSFDEIFTGTKLSWTRVPELEGWSPFSEGIATIDVIVPYLKARLKEIVELKRDKFDYNIFLEEKTNMAVMLSELHSENAKLKKDYDKNWAAMECLSFMDYKYEDGEWKPYED